MSPCWWSATRRWFITSSCTRVAMRVCSPRASVNAMARTLPSPSAPTSSQAGLSGALWVLKRAFCDKGVHVIRQWAKGRSGGIDVLKESLDNQRRAGGWIRASCLWPFSYHCHGFLSPQSYQFPDDVGISIGTPLDPQWIRLEVHYSNFQNLPGEYPKDFWEGSWWSQLSLLDMGDMGYTCWILLVTAHSRFPEHCDPPPPSEENLSFYSRHTWYLRDSAVLHLTPSQIWHGSPGAGHLSLPDSLYPPRSWGFPVLWAMQDREVWRGKAERQAFLEVSCSPSGLWANP